MSNWIEISNSLEATAKKLCGEQAVKVVLPQENTVISRVEALADLLATEAAAGNIVRVTERKPASAPAGPAQTETAPEEAPAAKLETPADYRAEYKRLAKINSAQAAKFYQTHKDRMFDV